jgi:hypothetical protein
VTEDQKVIKIETLAFQSHMGHLVYHLSEQILFRHLPGPTTKGVRKKVLDENIVIYWSMFTLWQMTKVESTSLDRMTQLSWFESKLCTKTDSASLLSFPKAQGFILGTEVTKQEIRIFSFWQMAVLFCSQWIYYCFSPGSICFFIVSSFVHSHGCKENIFKSLKIK